jgi:hypothetical protein
MLRIVVCSGTLLLLIAGLRQGLNGTFEAWGFGWGATVCVALMLISFLTAYLIDRADTRSREEQPRAPRDFR